jgi:hypothetical protein
MVKLTEFKNLPSSEKAAFVLTNGHFLHFRIKGWCKIDLYQIQSGPECFYVELWYYYDLQTVGLVRVFETVPPLEPYLENILIRVS